MMETQGTEKKPDQQELEKLIYEKEFTCPVCGDKFKDYVVKTTKIRYVSSDVDLRARYQPVDPLLYDIRLCQNCGYAGTNLHFDKITSRGAENIRQKISRNFKKREYHKLLTVEDAINRYKLALLSAITKNMCDSEPGYICMKIAWLYREAGDSENEQQYLLKTLEEYNKAYINEEFPICGMDEPTFSYILAAINKLTGKPQDAMKWLSSVLFAKDISDKLLVRAQDLKQELSQMNQQSK